MTIRLLSALAGIMLVAGIVSGCSKGDATADNNPAKQIDTSAKPTLPRPGVAIGGGGSTGGGSAPSAQPQ